ncbi:MAG: dTDP-4-dehydrorhamnose 3,5-epimerase family protein [Planctomycetota bacterium]|nr:dTDP-4-dehydrorhamnose 3,5-epimerase family protein [Planctomycetota bacterium]
MEPLKDRQTVHRDGTEVRTLIEGVRVLPLITHVDARGSLTQLPRELFSEPVVDAHQVSIRPGRVKGWIVHKLQTDRLFFWQGDLRVVLYDAREDSATYRRIDDLCFGALKPAYCVIPPGVFHAVQNLGRETASHMSFPTRAYEHADPDKYRLPLDTQEIPFDFNKAGW